MIGVVVATEREAEAVRGTLPRCAALFTAGVGKVNAATAAMSALWLGVDAVVNAGLAGGVAADARVGTAWCVSDAVQYDCDLSAVDGTEPGTVSGRRSPFFRLLRVDGLPSARCGTADRFGGGPRDAADMAFLSRIGCGIRDMECAAVAQVCERVRKPLYAVKVVSDAGRFPKPTAQQYRENMERCLARLSDAVRIAVGQAVADAERADAKIYSFPR